MKPVCICNECLDVCRKILEEDRKHVKSSVAHQAESSPVAAAASLACGFCGRSQEVVDKLISAPAGHGPCYICDRCVGEGIDRLAANPMAGKESLFRRLKRAFRSTSGKQNFSAYAEMAAGRQHQ